MNDRRRYALLTPLAALAPLLVGAAGASVTTWAVSADAAEAGPEMAAALRSTLERSAAGWSAGDLDAFMDVYEDSPDTLYVSGTRNIAGKAAIRQMYGSRFGHGAGTLGTLSFELDDIRQLGADHALVVGRFRLHGPLPDKPDATGVFTLVFHRAGGRWRIIVDHTG